MRADGVGGTTPGAARRRLARAGLAAGLAALVPLSRWVTGSGASWIPSTCLVRSVAGVPCPLCGLTHALAAASRGQWIEATSWNALWPVAIALIATFAALLVLDAVRDGRAAARLGAALMRHWKFAAVFLALFGIGRIPPH